MTENSPFHFSQGVYLDHQATTPLDPRALEAMMPYLTDSFGNPASVEHAYGKTAEAAVEKARAQIAEAICADPKEVIFTSGATEANNLALQGVMSFMKTQGPSHKKRVVVSAIEHKCVLETARFLSREGWDVVVVPVLPSGLVDMDALREIITVETALVSIVAVNNETGVIQPLSAIAALCDAKGAIFHSDAAQAMGKIPLSVREMAVGLLSFSAHKVYGPKGIGVLYVRRRPRVRLNPLFHGGGQERGLRSGTLASHLIVGMGEAFEIAKREGAQDQARTGAFVKDFWLGIKKIYPTAILNGDGAPRVASALNIQLPKISAVKLIQETASVAFSMGSACSSAELVPSHVLRAMNLNEEEALSSFRVCFGRMNGPEDVTRALEAFRLALEGQRLKKV